MIGRILNVAKILRPHHLLKAVADPRVEFRLLKYHLNRVSTEDLVRVVSGAPESEVAAALNDFEGRLDFRRELERRLAKVRTEYGGQMNVHEVGALYALIRLSRPRVMVETGVSDGMTSAIILRAMEDNGMGRLHSIDLPEEYILAGKQSGWLVPDLLRRRWDLRLGTSKDLLPPLLEELGSIDCFLHDSDHSYECMRFEFRTAWPRLRPGGLFFSHDVGQNLSFLEFVEEAGVGWREWRAVGVLGGFRKLPGSGDRPEPGERG